LRLEPHSLFLGKLRSGRTRGRTRLAFMSDWISPRGPCCAAPSGAAGNAVMAITSPHLQKFLGVELGLRSTATQDRHTQRTRCRHYRCHWQRRRAKRINDRPQGMAKHWSETPALTQARRNPKPIQGDSAPPFAPRKRPTKKNTIRGARQAPSILTPDEDAGVGRESFAGRWIMSIVWHQRERRDHFARKLI